METKGKRGGLRDVGFGEDLSAPMAQASEPSQSTIEAAAATPTAEAAAATPTAEAAAATPTAEAGAATPTAEAGAATLQAPPALTARPAAGPLAPEAAFLSALAQSQAMLAQGLEALSNEMAGLARSEIDAAARGATEMLAARTVVDAIEVNFGFARSSLDSWLDSAARLSELGARLTAEASQTLLAQLGRSWPTPPRFAA